MGNGVRKTAKVLACVLLAGCTREAPPRRGEASPTRYGNPEYEYAVQLPPGIEIETSTPPSPDHGFRVRLQPPAGVWVWAHYETENAHTLAEEVESVRESWSGCRMAEWKAATLGGVPAAELTFHCPAAPGGKQPETMRMLLAVRTPPDRGPVVYTVRLQHPQGTPAPEADRVYRALIDGFSFTRG